MLLGVRIRAAAAGVLPWINQLAELQAVDCMALTDTLLLTECSPRCSLVLLAAACPLLGVCSMASLISPHAGPEEAAPSALPRDHPLAELQAEDRTALGVALAQTLFCALAEGAGASCSDGLQRLLTEVFANDIAAFRRAPARWKLPGSQGTIISKSKHDMWETGSAADGRHQIQWPKQPNHVNVAGDTAPTSPTGPRQQRCWMSLMAPGGSSLGTCSAARRTPVSCWPTPFCRYRWKVPNWVTLAPVHANNSGMGGDALLRQHC